MSSLLMEPPTLTAEPDAEPVAAAADVPARTVKDEYDAVEIGVNKLILDKRHLWDPSRPDVRAAQGAVAALDYLVSRLPNQSRRTHEQEQYQQFSTPPHYAFAAVWVAHIVAGDVVMEPSAGVGGIAVHAANCRPKLIVLNELSLRRFNLLRDELVVPAAPPFGYSRIFRENAEQLHNVLPRDVRPTVVVMNPPFSATAGRMEGKQTDAGARHIEQALLRLEPGGRLVSIVGRGMGPDRPSFRAWWDGIKRRYTVRANVGVPGAEYAKYGTRLGTRLLVIDKAGPDQAEGCVTGDAADISSLVAMLAPVRAGRSFDAPAVPIETPAPVAPQPKPAPAAPSLGLFDYGNIHHPDEAAGAVPQPDVGGTGSNVAAEQAAGEVAAGEEQGAGDDQSPAQAGAAEPQGALTPEAESELRDVVFEPYVPRAARTLWPHAAPHPTPLVQSAAMASVEAPALSYVPAIPDWVIERAIISDAQLEAVAYAGQAFQGHLPETIERRTGEKVRYRRGFYIGDGTGVGKGRELSAIILDSFNRGQVRAVWVSKTFALAADARRDWSDLGQDPADIFELRKIKLSDPIPADRRGILFTTYATLRVGSDNEKAVDKTKEKVRGAFTVDAALARARGMWRTVTMGRAQEYSRALEAAAVWEPGDDLEAPLPPEVWKAARHVPVKMATAPSYGPRNLWQAVIAADPAYVAVQHATTPTRRTVLLALDVNDLPDAQAPANLVDEGLATAVKPSRLKQVMDWLGADFNGVIAFDEAHSGRNSLAK